MVKLRNATGGVSKVGYAVIIDSKDPNSFIYAPANATTILGIIKEAKPYREICEITVSGEALVYVNGNVLKGNTIRTAKSNDKTSLGTCMIAKSGDAPYLKIADALDSGKGLIRCLLNFAYFFSDDDSITWADITGKPTTLAGYGITDSTKIAQAEIDFGATPIEEKDFTITNTAIVPTSLITAQIAYVAPTGKSLDELEFDSFDFRCVAGTGSFTIHARALEGYVADKFKINYSYCKP
jgi:hypothetical protein